MRIGVLGAGISGLSIAKMLNEYFDVEILEKEKEHGGIARTKEVEGVAYHKVGGHCFNSKFTDVIDFVFNKIMPIEAWHKVQRDAVINFKNSEVSYPIEYSIQQIYKLNPLLAMNITRDFLNAEDTGGYKNLEDWFRQKFGNTLSEEYLIPYNTKIWNRSPAEMSPMWVDGKLPIPDKTSFFNGLINSERDKMPHSIFYYPNSNNQNTFINSLASGSVIRYNYPISKISYNESIQKWVINEELAYDVIISTLPLNALPSLIADTPIHILNEAKKLKFNRVTTMLWETKGTERTWTYVPDKDNIFHRYIHIGSFFRPRKNYSITEVVGERTFDEMVENGRKDPFLIRPVDYNVSELAYVVFDENYDSATSNIKTYLNDIGIYTLGRFGEWQYYNMDVCIKSGLDLSKKIIDRFQRK